MTQLRPHQQRALDAMVANSKGQIIVPTGGGKTLIAIKDALRQFESETPKTIVVVAPRILLAEQLSSEFLDYIEQKIGVLHVHSGETHHQKTTKSGEIYDFAVCNWKRHRLIFTTYHSLHRVQESGIKIDTIYFDEAHNSVQRNFNDPTRFYATLDSCRCYFFTATPKHSLVDGKSGMNDIGFYGKVICSVPAPELVESGYILPPVIKLQKFEVLKKNQLTVEVDCENLLHTIDDRMLDKILICAKSTKQITGLVSETHFCNQLHMRGYNWMYITAKTGAVINGSKVNREEFFNTLNEWGKGDKRFIVLHHSILSEGINVKGLEGVIFMRSMDYIGISQTIGRVIRKGGPEKTHGLISIPVYSKVGISTARKVEAVVDTVFEKGEPAISMVRR